MGVARIFQGGVTLCHTQGTYSGTFCTFCVIMQVNVNSVNPQLFVSLFICLCIFNVLYYTVTVEHAFLRSEVAGCLNNVTQGRS